MAYVAPTWRNGGPPALDAAALQAISDAIVANQTKNTQQDSSISSLQTAVNGKSRVATGSYTGTGTYGVNNPNSITFPFAPKLLYFPMIYLNESYFAYPTLILFQDIPTSNTEGSPLCFAAQQSMASARYHHWWRSGNTLYWYATNNASAQGNVSGSTYKYVCIG